MAVQIDQIRATAERVAASHNLDLVDLEFQGGSKHRTLRVYIEKNAAERAKLAEQVAAGTSELPKGVSVEMLSGVTHEDCAQFAQDFGTVLDVEDLIPGAEYTLEVSSPGLERSSSGPRTTPGFKAVWSSSRPSHRSTRTGNGKAVSRNSQTEYSRSTSLPS